MTDSEIQRKLNKLVALCNELDAEAKRRYGEHGQLFYEPESGFYVMDGDSDGGLLERQECVRFMSSGMCRMGSGAW